MATESKMKEKEKSATCAHSGRCFRGACCVGNMNKHVRTVHEKRRDHKCPHCAAAFGTADHLTRHVHAVHEQRRDHACLHCAAAYGTLGGLTRHVRTQHPVNTQDKTSARQ